MVWDPNEFVFNWRSAFFRAGDKKLDFQEYEIDFKNASMRHGKEVRYFTKKEAEKMTLAFTDIVTRYAVASLVWWKEGKGSSTPNPKADDAGILNRI